MKSYLLKYQETYCGRVEVKAKSLKEAKEKAVKLVEEGNGDIISSEVIILK
jgi:hypothetical protein